MRSDYAGHGRADQRKRNDPKFMCHKMLNDDDWREHFRSQNTCIMHGHLAARYVGGSNGILYLSEIIPAELQLLDVGIFPRKRRKT